MKCLVTGATGLLGSHVLLSLLEKKHTVYAMYRNEHKKEQVFSLFRFYQKEALLPQIQWVSADIMDVNSLYDVLEGIEQVYHCAAKVSFYKPDHGRMLQVNIEGTANVVNACLDAGVKQLCHVSSITALGTSRGEIDEETSWQNKTNPTAYSTSKYYAENEVWRGVAEGLQAVVVNPGVIIGPGNWNEGSAALFRRVYEGLKFYTDSTSGFVDVRDVANGMVLLMEKKLFNKRYLLVSENLSFKVVLQQIARSLGKREPYIKATPFLILLARYLEAISAWVLGKAPVITRESARIATDNDRYSNQRFIGETGFSFIPIKEAIENTGRAFLLAAKK